jgi:serine protease Do
VVADSPAARAGLKTGDVILSVSGESLDDPKDLPRIIANTKAGAELDMKVLRAGRTRNVSVEIGSSEPEALAMNGSPAAAPAGLGMRLSPLDDQARRQFGIPEASSGVLVTGVERNTPAAKAGIRPGQLISMVGQHEVHTPQDMLKEIDKAADTGRDSVLLLVEQRGGKQFVTVELSA